jgi:hypothetical protein
VPTLTRTADPEARARAGETGAPARSAARALGLRGLHLLVLSSLGIAQPLFTELEDGRLFILLNYGPSQLVLLALLAIFGPPLLLLAIEAVVRRFSRRAARRLHLCFVAGLAGIFVSQLVADASTPPSAVHAAVALLGGVAFAAAYAKAQPIRSIVTVLAPVPLVFLCLFLFSSGVGRVALADQGESPSPPVELPNPVVMIVLDEMSGSSLQNATGQIDEARFPNFARLAEDGTWFRNATTEHAFTDFAVPAILSGRRSAPDSLPTAADHPRNIFALLRGNPMTVEESFTDLCPRSLCPASGSPRDVAEVMTRTSLRQWLPPALSRKVADVQLENDPAGDAARFLASLGEADRPALHYLHLLLPHVPYVYLPSGKQHSSRATGIVGLSDHDWTRERWPVVQAQQLHLLQVMYLDRLIGAVIDRLEETGMYDRSLVVVVADHGVSFRPGNSLRDVTDENFPDILGVPFFVKAPDQTTGAVSDEFVRNTDALPTIVDVLGLDSPWELEGSSALAARTEANPRLDVQVSEGPEVTSFDARSFVLRRDEAVDAQAKLFGTGEAGLYRVGPRADLIGGNPPSGRVSDRAAIQLATPSPVVYRPDAAQVPSRVAGTVLGPGGPEVRDIAVVLNGRIAATTRTFTELGRTRFTALLPERRLRPGANRIAFYEITPGAAATRLRARG